MYLIFKKSILIFFSFILIFQTLLVGASTSIAKSSSYEAFVDIEESHYAYKDIHDLRKLGITMGIGNNKYGVGKDIDRAEFVTFLVRLLNLELVSSENPSFEDVKNNDWYYPYIETALKNNIIDRTDTLFRPIDKITREEIVIMIVNSLGYQNLAKKYSNYETKFIDVSNNYGYILLASDFGIINGLNATHFAPTNNAKREEAAAMMMRMYNKLNDKFSSLHAFYAINSYPQIDLVDNFDSIGFGWSSLYYDNENNKVYVNTKKSQTDILGVPTKFTIPFDASHNKIKLLSIFSDNKTIDGTNKKIIDTLLSNKENHDSLVNDIISKLDLNYEDSKYSFDGVIIDFEGLKGEYNKSALNEFLIKLNSELDKINKLLYVAVHPSTRNGIYFDGYDYKTIGEVSDKVILMAHDYAAKSLTSTDMNNGYYFTPLTPFYEVYHSLKSITDKNSGISDSDKIILQFSIDSIHWEMENNKIINSRANYLSYGSLFNAFLQNDVTFEYSETYKNPCAKYFSDNGNVFNIIWYENERSIDDKVKLANMFGIKNFSFWRLGTIPTYKSSNENDVFLDIMSVFEK